MKFESMNQIEHAKNSANHKYLNYNGQKDYYGAQGNAYYGANGGGAMNTVQMNPLDRTIVLEIRNTSGAAQTVRVWDQFFGDSIPAGVDVTLQNSNTSYNALKSQSASQPMYINSIKYEVTNASQFNNQMVVGDRSNHGALSQFDWIPRAYRSAQNQITTLIEDFSFVAQLTGNTFWQLVVNNNETIVFTFFLSAEFKAQQTLRGNSAIGSTQIGAPTGLAPQVVIPVRGSM